MAEITTVIPVYNGEKYILQTLESLAQQTRRPDRIVAVDDCSTDATREIVQSFLPIHCEWIPNPKNLGLFGNHNSALRFAAESCYFHILHANDLIAPSFFEKLIPLIENAPDYAMAFSGHVFIRENGERTSQEGGVLGRTAQQISLKRFLEQQTELKAIQLHSAVLKTSYKKSPVEFRLDLPQLGDIVFHSEFAAHCSQIWAHPEIMSYVRIHTDSATSKNIKNINAWVLDEWKAMQIVFKLMQEHGIASWTRGEKLRLLYAARCIVKIQTIAHTAPDYAQNIKTATKPLTGNFSWAIASAIVKLRDLLQPKQDQTSDRLGTNAKGKYAK
ncbi:MAG: glycosyltransferase family A protein [Verrucomicrobiota bacterium]|nr:glycosyltransferase family A protein [Verrucomicrobiota bacterium]